MGERLVAIHSFQQDRSSRRSTDGMVILTEDEASKLEDALRLARTGKLGKERPVGLSRVLGGVSTRIVVKGYEPKGGA